MKITRFFSLLAVGLSFVVCWAACGQEAPSASISTERPTAGYSPDLIPAGSLQVENGANVSFQRSQYMVDLPESLIRMGLTDRLEVRVLVSNMTYSSNVVGSENAMQTQDLAFSVKALVSGPNSYLPKSAVLSLSVPTGGPAQTSGSRDPSLSLIWTQSNAHGYFLNELAQATLTTLDGARRPLWSPSVAGGKALSESLGVFAEYAPNVLPDDSRSYIVDGGVALVHGKLQQFDLRTGYLKDSGGYHTLISIGYSYRRDGFPWNSWTSHHATKP
jgi:hypothetical protein